MHDQLPHFINFIGSLVGWLGITIALYLQFVSAKDCPARYVLVFFLFGASMIVIHVSPSTYIESTNVVILRLLAYFILSALQVVIVYRLYHRLNIEGPVEALENALRT